MTRDDAKSLIANLNREQQNLRSAGYNITAIYDALRELLLDASRTEVENSANEAENLLTKGLWKQVFNFDGP